MKLLAELPLLLLAMTLMMAPSAGRAAAAPTCRNSSAVTDACTVVEGSLGLTEGVGVTLHTNDGRRILIKAPPDSNADIPRAVMQRWLYLQTHTGDMAVRLKGRYQVCPLPAMANAAGIHDTACINSASHIRADPSRPDAIN